MHDTVAPGPAPDALEIVPLGGLGEFGMNMLAMTCAGTTILIDAGVMFPDPDQLGVDLIIPDLTYLETRRPSALLLTHGHEDHIGAVPHVLPLVDGPVHGTPFTLALVEPKLAEHGLDARGRLAPVAAGDTVRVGPFSIEFIRVTHSMPDCVALAVTTPYGTVVHTGDFKVDHTPVDGQAFDLHRFAAVGRAGVLALLGDSTNVDRPGSAGSERDVVPAFEELFAATNGKLVVAAFSSSLHRIQLLVNLAARFHRKVAFLGRSLVQNTEIAQRLGLLRLPEGLQIRDADVPHHAADEVLCVTTGSQGEPRAALSRIAIDDHRHVRLGPGDTVVFSARAIPGNEKAIARTMSHIARRGAEVVTVATARVHVSGHAGAEELRLMLALTRPRYVVPIHGEYRQLAAHGRLAERVLGGEGAAVEVLIAGDGDVIRFDADGARIAGQAPAGRVLIDDTRLGEVDDQVLRDRRRLAGDGVVIAVVGIAHQDGTLVGEPELVARGMVLDEDAEGSLFDGAAAVITDCIGQSPVEERTDQGLITEKLRVELRRYFKKRTGRRPMVVPVLLEI
jgi:ribonuclease J